MTTSVIVVNWNAGGALTDCVASLAAEPARGTEVLIVDNGSTDQSSAAAAAHAPWVRVIETGENLGFAGGANRGAAGARGDVLVFLNPDARVLPGAVETLVCSLTAAPGAGIAGGGLVDGRGRWQPGWARFDPLRHLVLDTTLGRLGTRWHREPHPVDWVYGTFMAMRADLFRHLGGFDTRYFVYGEDMDICFRAARLGARTLFVPTARAIHGDNVSAVQRFGNGREAEVVKGEMRFYAGRGPQALRLFRAVATCKFGAKAILAATLGRTRSAATYARVVRACVAYDPRCA